jgi:hypothetical protein
MYGEVPVYQNMPGRLRPAVLCDMETLPGEGHRGGWIYTDFEDCKKLDFLTPAQGDAH